MQRSIWTRFHPYLALPLAMLLWLAGVPTAVAGDPYETSTTSESGWTTTSKHTNPGTNNSGTTDMGKYQLPTGTFYKHDPSSWSTKTEKTYFQKQDGSVAAKDKTGTTIPTSVILAKADGELNVWKGEVESEAGDKASLSVLGVQGIAMGTAGYTDGTASATGTLIGRAYLLQGSAETRQVGVGDANLGVHVSAKAWGMVGVEGKLSGTAKVGKEGVALEAKAEVFAGAKAMGQIPLTISLCKMKATGRIRGEVSAGAGAKAVGTIKIDWAKGTATISGELAATLGLGAGVGADVVIDLQELVKDPAAVGECLLDGVKELASAAVELGGDLVDAAGSALATAGEAIVDAADTVGTALANGASRATAAVGNAVSSAGSAIAGFFGWGSDPAPPIPPVRPGNNTPIASNTRPVTITIMMPAGNSGAPSPTRSLKAQRQAYPH